MASENTKGKSPTADPGQSVLGSLPSTRPARMGRRRETATGEDDAGTGKRAATATAEPKPAKPKPAARKAPKTAAKPKQKPKPKPQPKSAARAGDDRPRAVRSGSPRLKPGPKAPPPRAPESSGPPSGTKLVTTSVQAAGELAQIGLSIGGRAIKRAASRIPKP